MVYGDLPCSWLCYGGSNTQGMKVVVNCIFPPVICKNIISLRQNMLGSALPPPAISGGFHPAQQTSDDCYKFCLAVSLGLSFSPLDKLDKPPLYQDPKEQSPLQTV